MIDYLEPNTNATLLGFRKDLNHSEYCVSSPATLEQALIAAKRMIDAGHIVSCLMAGGATFFEHEIRTHLGL